MNAVRPEPVTGFGPENGGGGGLMGEASPLAIVKLLRAAGCWPKCGRTFPDYFAATVEPSRTNRSVEMFFLGQVRWGKRSHLAETAVALVETFFLFRVVRPPDGIAQPQTRAIRFPIPATQAGNAGRQRRALHPKAMLRIALTHQLRPMRHDSQPLFVDFFQQL